MWESYRSYLSQENDTKTFDLDVAHGTGGHRLATAVLSERQKAAAGLTPGAPARGCDEASL